MAKVQCLTAVWNLFLHFLALKINLKRDEELKIGSKNIEIITKQRRKKRKKESFEEKQITNVISPKFLPCLPILTSNIPVSWRVLFQRVIYSLKRERANFYLGLVLPPSVSQRVLTFISD
jgi:hypothetical protein